MVVFCFRKQGKTQGVVSPHNLALLSVQWAAKKREVQRGITGWTDGSFLHRREELLYDSWSSDEEETTAERSSMDDKVVFTAAPLPPKPAAHHVCFEDDEGQVTKGRVSPNAVNIAEGKERESRGFDGNISRGAKNLSHIFGSGSDAVFDSNITSRLGMQQLTRLVKATSARIVVYTLTLDNIAIDELIRSSRGDNRGASVIEQKRRRVRNTAKNEKSGRSTEQKGRVTKTTEQKRRGVCSSTAKGSGTSRRYVCLSVSICLSLCVCLSVYLS